MSENLFGQPADDLSMDQNYLSPEPTTGGDPILPPNVLTQPALYNDNKGKPLMANPKARAAAANNLLQGRDPLPQTLEEMVVRNNAALQSNPLMQSGAQDQRAVRESVVRRYDDQDYGYLPGIDNDDFYGKRESWYETAGKGILRLPTYVASKTLEGVGFVAGMINPFNWGLEEGIVSKAADNALYKAMNSFDDWTKNEWMPTFQEAADRDKGFFNRMFTDGDFWAEDAVDGVAFMASAFIPGMALSKLGLGARAMSALGATRFGAQALGASVEGAEAIANYFTKAQQAAKSLDQFSTWAIATTSESMFEAKEVRDKVRESLQDTQKADGSYYTYDEINKIAGDASRNTFLSNALLLGATNVFQMKYFTKSLMSGGIQAGESLAAKATLSPAESALKYYGKVIGGGIAREGFVEENLQLAIQRVNERYGTEGKLSSFLDLGYYSSVLDQYGRQTIDAVKGDDAEASTSIGLGGLLGAGSNVVLNRGERDQKKLTAESALNAYTQAQENWLKFGNIYKTEEVKTKDANGNDVVTNKLVLDPASQPIIDEDKLSAVLTGIQGTSDMLVDASMTKNKAVRDFLRLSAFSEFVQAHINGGLETSLIDKLDALKKASPEDLAKLGFAAGPELQADIEKHKSIAGKIIRQNKILNESILFDDSKEDRARKLYLTDLAAKQVITREQLSVIDQDYNETKEQLLDSQSTALSDGMVDQLNELLYRIESHKEFMEDLKKSGRDVSAPMEVYKKLEQELKQSLKTLEENNPETIKTLKKDTNGFYQYEKDDRNDVVVRAFLDRSLKQRGEVLNSVKLQGYQWSYYADNKNGKKNFSENFNKQVELVNQEKKKKEEEAKAKEKEQAEKKKTEETAEQKPEETEVEKKEAQDKPAAAGTKLGEIKDNDDDDLEDFLPGDGQQETKDKKPAQPAGSTNTDPGLDAYLRMKFDILKNDNLEFNLDYDEWISTGAANFFIRKYNKEFGKNEPAKSGSSSKSTELDDQGKQELVDGLSIANTTKATLQKAVSAIQDVLTKLKGDNVFIDKILAKIDQIKDEVVRLALRATVTGVNEPVPSTYIPLADVGIDTGMEKKEHTGYGMITINNDELETGFILKEKEQLIKAVGSDLSDMHDRIRVVASRAFVNAQQRLVSEINIPNRTAITYETPLDIAKLKSNKSIIAVASRSRGFNTQFFPKNSTSSGNAYLAGIDNFMIVHPDNRTEPVTFSEEQREFVKSNMMLQNGPITDEEYNRLQRLYNKLQAYNSEVELVLADNEEMDITPIFNKYFTIAKSGRQAAKGQRFEELMKANPETLWRVTVRTESGEIVEKDVPLVTESFGDGWITDFVLDPSETLVTVDPNTGEVATVTNRKTYMEQVHGISPKFTKDFKGGVYAWLAKTPSDPKGFKPLMLKRDKGTEPVAYFKKFANEFRELKDVLEKGSKTKEYVYKGKTFTTVNELMNYFNINHYGFYRAGDWNINLSYSVDGKVKNKKFAFEFRPADKAKRNQLTKEQKQALNLYFADDFVLSVQDSMDDAAVIEAYNSWVKNLISGLIDLGNKLEQSDDPVQREMRGMLNSKAMFFYEVENKKKEYFLKLVDKSADRTSKFTTPVHFLRYDAKDTSGKVTVALNEEPVAPAPKKPSTKPSGLVSLGTLNDDETLGTPSTPPPVPGGKKRIMRIIEDDAPFMLRTEEQYERYTEQSYNEEVRWLAGALKNSGIKLSDLGSIIDNLSAKRQVLGYYKDRAIYVNRSLSAEGTIYHEAFHGLFRDIFTAEQRAFYLDKARGKMGKPTQTQINEFRNERNYYSKTDQEIVDLMAEELLAEGFRKYKLSQKEPSENWFKRFVKMIERLINFFDRNQRAINKLYNNFDNGAFADMAPQADNSLSKEGVYALAYGRPMLAEYIENGEVGYQVLANVPMNMEVQNELIAKLTYKVANMREGSFTAKFERAVEELKADYDIDTLIAANDPTMSGLIRNRYENKFSEASYVLGVPVKYVLDDSLVNDPEAAEQFTDPGMNKKTLDFIKSEVKQKIDTLGLEAGFASDDLQVPEDDEDRAEKEKGGEFDKVHINPLEGLSKEFRSLFGIIPYTYEDPTLGIKINRVADGNMLFNAMIKVASDKPIDQILPALDKAVTMMEEDQDPNYAPLKAFADFIQSQFGIADLSDSTSKPTRNLFLYKQFIDTFFVTELPSYVIRATTTAVGSKTEVFDASINQDIKQKKEALKFYYEKAYRKLDTPEALAEFEDKFNDLKEYLRGSLFQYLKSSDINDRKNLNKVVDELKSKMDAVNIVLPKGLIRQSLLAIYVIEEENTLNPNSKRNLADLENDQRLMKEGAYLQADFFKALSQVKSSNYANLFADTRDKNIDFGGGERGIEQLNKILKKAAKYIIKYDINSAISVFQNAENKNIYRYTRYTPPVLLAQLVREKGVGVISDMYPVLATWMQDNKLFDGSAENELFLENLYMSSFGGIRQEIGDDPGQGVTFGSIDPKSFHLSAIVHFMNRDKITGRRKDEKGKYQNVDVITFKRSRTQEEATTTNFLVTGKYTRYVSDKKANNQYAEDMMGMLRQEYNRISREFSKVEKTDVLRYKDYNDSAKGRAFKFVNFVHFFNQHKNSSATNLELRQQMENELISAAKQGITFEQALATGNLGQLSDQLKEYGEETFKVYLQELKDLDLVKENKDGTWSSTLIPKKIRQDFKEFETEAFGYDDLVDLLKDFHFNVELNKRMVNQIFDGDIATGIKSVADYYKRNKSGVISGNSMKTGYFRTAVVDKILAYIPSMINPITGKEDFDITAQPLDEEGPGTIKVDIADGQSYHTMNHRIRMMESWGRVDNTVKAILRKAKYQKLSKEDIETLEDRKVVLNTIKTATGGILEYYKLSEHLINRVDVSRLVVREGMTREQVETRLEELYTEIENLEDIIVEDPAVEDASKIEEQIEKLYEEVHTYWEPKRGREKLHHLLNSMELDGIDQLFDPNASKKTTLVPIKLQADGRTNLKASKSYTSGMFKFMQVETSGVKDKITLPTQARQLLTTYLTRLDQDMVYRKKSLKDLAQEYTETLGDITDSATKMLDKLLLDEKGELNVSQLFTTMYNGLKKQGADSNTLKYFAVKDGKPVHDPNLPAIKKIFTYYYFSLFNDSIFSQKVSGRSDILVSEYGYQVLYDSETGQVVTQMEQDQNPDLYRDTDRFRTRPLGISVEKVNGKNVYTVEVMIPEHLAENESERQLYLTRLTKFFSTRIPTEDKRSMIVAKVVDYLDPSYRNSIVVPQLVHILAGSDLDVDKLYSHTFEHYLSYDGVAHVFGDYSNYATESQGKFAEYIQYMSQHPSFRDLVQAELETMIKKPVFTPDFLKVAQELGLSTLEMSVDEMRQKRADILENIDILDKARRDRQLDHDVAFENWVRADKKNRRSENADWQNKRVLHRMAKDSLDAAYAELQEVKAELKKMDNTLRMAALVNVLKSKKMPVTQTEYTKYLKDNPTPVLPVLNNLSLQQKIDILSNEKVFKNFYVNERSTVDPFRDVAEQIGASVDSVVTENSIFSVMGDAVANELNSSSKDGIGIAASFNKFLAFAEKNEVSIPAIILDIDEADFKHQRTGFTNSDGIRRTGQTLGMFADAAKEPIPSVLNLNPDTSGVSNVIVGLTGNLQLGLLINKIPVIENITDKYRSSQSAVKEGKQSSGGSLRSLIKEELSKRLVQLEKDKRLGEIFDTDEAGDVIYNQYRPIYMKTVEPAKSQDGKLAAQMNRSDIRLSNLGIELYYEDGSQVTEDVAEAYLLSRYGEIMTLNADILKLGKILNLIKNQEPDFNNLDQILANHEYFMSGTSYFGGSIIDALQSSKEYTKLIQAASKMNDYSRRLLMERNPLFKSIQNILLTGMNNTYRNDKAKQELTDQIGKFVIINKIKADIKQKIEVLKTKEDEDSQNELQMLEESAKYFTADFWLDNNTLVDDLDYLNSLNPGNPFIEFIKVNTRQGIDYLEATSRMKLDKDLTESIINGYESLQKSKDQRTMRLSRQLFFYLLAKDGLGYGAFTFIKYLNPDLKQMGEVSGSLRQFQELLISQQNMVDKSMKLIQSINNSGKKAQEKQQMIDKVIDDIFENYTKLFDTFFNNSKRAGQIDWVNGIVNKIFSFAGNQRYVQKTPSIVLDSNDRKQAMAEAINAGVFSHIEPVQAVKDKYLNYIKKAPEVFTIDFSKIEKSTNKFMDDVFSQFSPMRDLITGELSMNFRVLLSDEEGNLYKLSKIDDRSISKAIARYSMGVGGGLINTGLKAEYVKLDVEGTKNLLNFGFNKADGIKLYQKAQSQDETLDQTKMMLSYSKKSSLSDNKTKEEAPSKYEELSGPYDISEAQLVDEEDIEAQIASGKLRGTKIKTNTGQQQAPDEIGFKVVGSKPTSSLAKEVEKIVTAPGYVKQSAEKHLSKELFKIRQATKFIGTGGGNDSTTQRMQDAYDKFGAANTIEYSANDLIYVSSNGDRSNRFNPVVNGELKGVYKDIDLAINAGARFIMDTKAHLDATARYNIGEVALAQYLRSKGYQREDATGIWSPAPKSAATGITNTAPVEITYTPIGKTQQTYKIVGAQIFNKDGVEVFKGDSKDRNRIFANLAVKQGRAVVVTHKDADYVVNTKGDIISVTTGDKMQWGPENGDRKAIIELAQKKFEAKKPKDVREYTPERIETLKPNEVFVFGSNVEGRHGLGAAKTASDKFGAKYFQAEGLQGQSYAIVTKKLNKEEATLHGVKLDRWGTRSVPLNLIGKGIQDMLLFAKANPGKKFYVTKLGTENAGYSVAEMRMLFEKLVKLIPDNVILPREFEVRDQVAAQPAAQAFAAGITLQEVDEIYRAKSTKTITLEEYRKEAAEYINTMAAVGMSKSAILEQVKCL